MKVNDSLGYRQLCADPRSQGHSKKTRQWYYQLLLLRLLGVTQEHICLISNLFSVLSALDWVWTRFDAVAVFWECPWDLGSAANCRYPRLSFDFMAGALFCSWVVFLLWLGRKKNLSALYCIIETKREYEDALALPGFVSLMVVFFLFHFSINIAIPLYRCLSNRWKLKDTSCLHDRAAAAVTVPLLILPPHRFIWGRRATKVLIVTCSSQVFCGQPMPWLEHNQIARYPDTFRICVGGPSTWMP